MIRGDIISSGRSTFVEASDPDEAVIAEHTLNNLGIDYQLVEHLNFGLRQQRFYIYATEDQQAITNEIFRLRDCIKDEIGIPQYEYDRTKYRWVGTTTK